MDLKFIFYLFLLLLIGLVEGLNERIDCHIENNFKLEQKSCEDRGCVWDSSPIPNGIPICYLNTKTVGYKALNTIKKSENGIEAELVLKETSKKLTTFPQIENLKLEVNYLTDRILRFKIFDPKHKRYEVPVQKDFPLLQKNPKESDETKRKYSVELSYEESKDNFHFTVSRKDNKNKVFDTSIGGLLFSDQFIQIATYLPSKNIYGLGENTHQSLRHDLNYKTWPMFTRDFEPAEHEKNLYGHHPFYTCLENDGKSHGVFLLNSNAMEATLLPQPAINLRTFGGILDFFVFIGDNPEQVISLYTSLIGRPVMPPFWGLGFQLCRWGRKDINELKAMVDRNHKENIPLDVMYIDSDYKDKQRDFTWDSKNWKGLPEYMSQTKKENNLRWALIVDPGIEGNDTKYEAFTDGYKEDVFVKWPKSVPINERHSPTNVPNDKDVYYGHVWPDGPLAYPDFFKNRTKDFWERRINHLHNELNLTFDALWIDMNEPSNFAFKCPHNKYDFPEVRIKAVWAYNKDNQLSDKTLCMTTVQGENNEYQHYDVHSLYGLTESIATRRAIQKVTGKRGFVVSRSSYASSGRYANHWLGDNSSKWPHIRYSIIGMLEFNMFGIPFVGPDTCGFYGEPTPELCRRWSALGAFYPFSRNHNEQKTRNQDPAAWAEIGYKEVTDTARDALQLRYAMMPYLYTLFYRSHTLGETVARPVFHEFPNDNKTHDIDQQFMWGRSVLISPFLFENQTEVSAYLPNDIWYDLNRGQFTKSGNIKIMESSTNGAPPVHIRGGSVIPIVPEFVGPAQQLTSEVIRKNAIQLVVIPGKTKTASGDLFWDDGESVDTIENDKYNYYTFELHSNCTLEINVIKSGYSSGLSPELISWVNILGTNNEDIVATIDGKAINKISKSSDGIGLGINIDLKSKKAGAKWVIDWKTKQSKSCNLQ